MSSLKASDPNTIEMAVRFLEADPCFFRSGYIKADLIKHLCRAQSSNDQRTDFDRYSQGRDARQLRSYCRLARIVGNPAFERDLANLAASPVPLISRHAQWVFKQLTHSARKINR